MKTLLNIFWQSWYTKTSTLSLTDIMKEVSRVTPDLRAQNIATRPHQLTLKTKLPPQKIALSVTSNKIQLIAVICKYLLKKTQALDHTYGHKLVITEAEPIPKEVTAGMNDIRST